MFQTHLTGLMASLFAFVFLLSSPTAAQDGIALELQGALDPINLSLEDLDSMPQIALETSTIWTDGVNTFSGVSLKALLEAQNANGTVIEMIALNDYAVKMPIADLQAEAPIIATRMNGETMPVREKGPYWVVFPYDADTQFQTEIVYSRSIWQLNRLMVLEE